MRSLDQYYRSRSLWLDGVPGSLEPRPSLPDDIDADVAIIGAGCTGLWTAHYLAAADEEERRSGRPSKKAEVIPNLLVSR